MLQIQSILFRSGVFASGTAGFAQDRIVLALFGAAAPNNFNKGIAL